MIPTAQNEAIGQTFSGHALIENAQLSRDEKTKLPALDWQLRLVDEQGKTLEVRLCRQIFSPENLDEIKGNLRICGIVSKYEDLPSHLIKASGCEVEISWSDAGVQFVRRIDSNIFAGEIIPQQAAADLPL